MKDQDNDDGWWRFCRLCVAASTEEDVSALLECFLTIEEREMLTKRTQIIRELLKGEKTQRTIAAEQGVSIAAITRGSNQLKTLSHSTKAFLEHQLL